MLPYGLDKLLIIAVLTSASASTQTTILPGTRAALSMAAHGACAEAVRGDPPRAPDPGYRDDLDGVISIVWYVVLTIVSENILCDSITATGLMIVFYLGITGVACVIYFRKALFNDVRTFLLAGVGPALGAMMMGYILVKSAIDQFEPGELGVGRVVARDGPAARDRDPRPHPRRRPDGACSGGTTRRSSGASASRRPGDAPVSGRLVLGYDESPSANAALAADDRARARARRRTSWSSSATTSRPGAARARARFREAARRGRPARARPAPSRTSRTRASRRRQRLVEGKPADALIAVAEEVGADTIVVGTVGENPISGALLGSVVLELVQRSTVPLLVVPARATKSRS